MPGEDNSINISNNFDKSELLDLKFSDPLFLHPNNTSPTPLINFKLIRIDNYNMWSCAMKFALRNKSKLDFIDGTCKRKSDDPVLTNKWDLCNSVVVTWILNYVSAELYAGRIYSKTAFDILPACTYEAAKHYENHANQTKLMQFLMGLDDVYQPIRSNILTREPLPLVKIAFAVVSGEKSHWNVGHTVERCFDLVGYLPNYKKQGNQNANKYTVNNAISDPNTSTASNVSFSNEQMLKLLSLIDDKSVSNYVANMADSGANQHMTASAKFLINVVDVSNLGLTVGHPNGTKAKIVKIGDSKLNDFVTLFNVLVVPEYTMNLLSVYSLAKDKTGVESGVSKDLNHINFSNSGQLYDEHPNLKRPNDEGRVPCNNDGIESSPLNKDNGDSDATFIEDNAHSEGNTKSVNQYDESEGESNHTIEREEGIDLTEHIDCDDVAEPVRRSSRQTKLSLNLNDYVVDSKVKFGLNKIKDLGNLKYFLFIEVLVSADNIFLSQRKYCIELMHEFGMLGCKPTSVPIEPNIGLNFKVSDDDPALNNITGYQN
nr:hypothetical protein [Tanacetum cinerariifolium]